MEEVKNKEEQPKLPASRLSVWNLFPKLSDYIIRGNDLPQNLQEYFFGIIEIEMHLSNLPKEFVYYSRASVNCLSMLVPILEDWDKIKEFFTPPNKNAFVNEVNAINVECKGMVKPYRAVDGFTMKELSMQRFEQFQELKTNMKKDGFIKRHLGPKET